MDQNYKTVNEFPATIPIFPLEGVVMFPDTYLPLNIFEPRYVKMFDKAISDQNRLIGMVQPNKSIKNNDKNVLYDVGCAGKIIKFEETYDQRYLITLKGLIRFNLISENTNKQNFKEANVSWDNFSKDLEKNKTRLDLTSLKLALKQYFKVKDMTVNWNLIDKCEDYNFVDQIVMICPFAFEEKQLFLQTNSIEKRSKLLQTILDSYICESNISKISKH